MKRFIYGYNVYRAYASSKLLYECAAIDLALNFEPSLSSYASLDNKNW